MRVEDHGTIVLLCPETAAETGWLDEHVAEDAMWWGGGLVCEPRYVGDILAGMARDIGEVGNA